MKTPKLFSKFALSVLLALLLNVTTKANNLQITGTSVSGSNITFSIAWDNSWNADVAPANWDAVWVFIKYQDCNTRLWAHTNLSTLATDHSAGSPLQVDTVTDGKGVFIRRSALGGGNIAATTVTLKMTGLGAGPYNFKVFGIEMVNVPQGAYNIGDTSITGAFTEYSVASDGAITAASLGGTPAAGNIPVAYPAGFSSFYCMKYEISQEQYVDFLNALTYDQQRAHTVTDPISAAGSFAMYSGTTIQSRNGVKIITPGSNNAIPAIYGCDATSGIENNIDDGQNVAMGYLTWADLAAYLDWAALRPMTELEYEKACRGAGQPRIAGEYPWGTTEINFVYGSNITNSLRPNEGYSTPLNGLCNVLATSGYTAITFGLPTKVGLSATGSSGRASSGSTFYGAKEMAGNMNEVIVNATATGVTFTGVLGDGTILANGDSDASNWPTTASTGVGYKGGSYASNVGGWGGNGSTYAKVSYRGEVALGSTTRSASNGGRGVR